MEGEAAAGAPSTKKHGGSSGDGGGGWGSLSLAPQPSLSPRVTAESFAAMPLLGHRYRYVSTIGAGRFSNVIRCAPFFSVFLNANGHARSRLACAETRAPTLSGLSVLSFLGIPLSWTQDQCSQGVASLPADPPPPPCPSRSSSDT